MTSHTLLGVVIVSIVFPFSSPSNKLNLIRWWHRRLLAALNLQVTAHGFVPQAHQVIVSTMIVANHISWLDIHALNSMVPLRFIAKSDIKHWPVIGFLAKRADVLFVERDKRKDAVRIAHLTASSLSAGDNLCLFPEGATTDGTKMMPFKSSIMQAVIHANATVQAVAIRYPHHHGGINTAMAYANETTMKQSIFQILQQKNPTVELHFLAPIVTAQLTNEDKDRRKLTLQIEQNIRATLGL
ncbi:MAG: lysophospholipid acyltransferase family protein [Methylophilaceae bacterium]